MNNFQVGDLLQYRYSKDVYGLAVVINTKHEYFNVHWISYIQYGRKYSGIELQNPNKFHDYTRTGSYWKKIS